MFNRSDINQNRSFDDLVDQNLLKIEVFTMSLVFTLAVIGNTVVILTLTFGHLIKPKKSRSKHTAKLSRMNFYILHLSIADIYVSFGNILTMLIWRKNNNLFFGGDLTCRLVVYFQLVSVYYSTYVLIAMTIDRYEAICRPFLGLSWSRQRGMLYITIAFLISHLQGLPQIYFFRLQEIPGLSAPVFTCYAEFKPLVLQNIYIIYTWVMQFLIPICIIIGCYSTISIKVFKSIKGKSDSKKSRSTYLKKNSNQNTFNLNGIDETNIESSKTFSTNTKNHSFGNSIVSKFSYKQTLSISSDVSGPETYRLMPEFRQHCQKNYSKSKIKTIKLTLTVIIMYIICSTPYFIGMILNVMLPVHLFNIKIISMVYYLQKKFYLNICFLEYMIVLSCLLLQLNSCVNPW